MRLSTQLLSSGFIAAVLFLAGCTAVPPQSQAYWQRVDDETALWMTGPKAQQRLDQEIAACVREVDEMVELDALRETTPPDTHSDYHRALKKSGDLDFYDTPTRLGSHKVAHSDYHDFESCMRSKGWERVNYIRYQTAAQSKDTYADTQSIRRFGVPAAVEQKKRDAEAATAGADYSKVNQ